MDLINLQIPFAENCFCYSLICLALLCSTNLESLQKHLFRYFTSFIQLKVCWISFCFVLLNRLFKDFSRGKVFQEIIEKLKTFSKNHLLSTVQRIRPWKTLNIREIFFRFSEFRERGTDFSRKYIPLYFTEEPSSSSKFLNLISLQPVLLIFFRLGIQTFLQTCRNEKIRVWGISFPSDCLAWTLGPVCSGFLISLPLPLKH